MVLKDLREIYKQDSAAQNWLEAQLCYPDLQYLGLHCLAHGLHQIVITLLPHFISYNNCFLMGIEIYPGIRTGNRVFIGHGRGSVIWETATVGDRAVIQSLGSRESDCLIEDSLDGAGI